MEEELDESKKNETSKKEKIYIQKIKDLMKYIIEENNKNKYYKISLYKIRGFEPYTIFNEIDTISSGLINHSDLSEYLSKNNFEIDKEKEKEIIPLFIREYNKQENDNNLNAQDFVKFLNYDIDKTSFNIGELDFDKNNIRDHFLILMKSEFNLIKEKNILINDIKNIKEFSTYGAFDIITNEKKYIDYDCLNNFLEKKYSKKEIKELIYRLDMNNDGKIDYNEFQDLFFPFQEHLQLEETNDIDNYDDLNNNNYDIKIDDKYYCNLNPYKDNTFTEPKIIDNYEKENDNNNKAEILLSSNLFKNEEETNNNDILKQKENYINSINKYDSTNNFTIKYDENLFNEITERQNDNKNNNELPNENKNSNNNNNDNKLESEKFSIYNSMIYFGDDDDNGNKPQEVNDEIQIKKNDVNENNNNNSDKNMTSKSDTLISNNDSNPHKINDNNNNIIEKENNFKDIPENLSNKKNFTDIFTENDKMIINIFIDFIYSITILESKEENLRESLSLCDDIDLYAIFNIFNVDKTNYISKMNFTDVCNKEYLLFPTELQIKLIYDRFDLNNDEQLDIEEFINMMTPLNKAYLTLCNKDNFDTNKNISFESKKKIINLLKAIIDNESITYELRTKLISNKNFNFIDLWGLLMKYSQDDNTLTKKEFNNFLENFGCYFTQCELDIIFNKLSKGKDLIEYSTLYNGIIN